MMRRQTGYVLDRMMTKTHIIFFSYLVFISLITTRGIDGFDGFPSKSSPQQKNEKKNIIHHHHRPHHHHYHHRRSPINDNTSKVPITNKNEVHQFTLPDKILVGYTRNNCNDLDDMSKVRFSSSRDVPFSWVYSSFHHPFSFCGDLFF